MKQKHQDRLSDLRNKFQTTRSKNIADDLDTEIANIHVKDIGEKSGLMGILRRTLGGDHGEV